MENSNFRIQNEDEDHNMLAQENDQRSVPLIQSQDNQIEDINSYFQERKDFVRTRKVKIIWQKNFKYPLVLLTLMSAIYAISLQPCPSRPTNFVECEEFLLNSLPYWIAE